ncbi:MAG: type I DNA topoisomerase [Candidatus Cloacimonetes bacterium]|nr:type I DNA topoisomerase [Candidatus Cloacimonadota bacterium]
MAKGLIIVESPAKAKTIGKFLDNQFTVKASMGHIRDLPAKDFGINVDKNFEPRYVTDPKKAKIIRELKEALAKAPALYLASDHDREGEAIAWHLVRSLEKELGNKPVHRVLFNEITAKAIQHAIQNPEQIDQAKVDAQQARRVLDRIVGYRISPLLWSIIAKDLSAGRVQSVALRLICERETEIREFVPKEYWKLEAEFWRDELPHFKAALEKVNGKKADLNTEAEALQILSSIQGKPAVLADIKRVNRSLEPPPPFITSTLQQEASKILNFPSSRTMSIAQQLYEGVDLGGETVGLISYMRTDSVRISEEANARCRDLIKERFGESQLNGRIRSYKNKNSAQDAHEAIRPTDPFRTPEALAKHLKPEQLKLYTLIWQRFIATQMIAATLRQTTVNVQLAEATFSASGNEVVEQGFIKAYPHVSVQTGEFIHPSYAQGDDLEYKDMAHSQHFTSPPSRFTEASLIKELEAKGIGRPSTYATIITTLKQRKYVEMEKKSFLPTTLGMDVNVFLVGKFDAVFNVRFTAEMEDKLDRIEEGKVVWQQLVRDYYEQLEKLIGQVDVKKEKTSFIVETEIVCDACQEGRMVLRRTRNGEFLACNRYPQCKNKKNVAHDEKGEIKVVEPQKMDEKCPQCGKDLILRRGRFGEFIACSAYPKCKYTRPVTLSMKCPKCHEGDIVPRRNKKGMPFHSCSRYPQCDWITNDTPVPTVCPQCGHEYLFESYKRGQGKYKFCPRCKAEMG